MPTKRISPEILNYISTRLPMEIPFELQHAAKRLGIKEIYYLRDENLSKYGVYGNHLVIVEGNKFIDFDISPINSIHSIISLLSI